ncbi:MAG: ATP-binding protein [Myxococcota bacterium]
MARLHLLIGPVGSGKSTFARRLCREHDALRLTLDEWMTVLFRPDRPPTGRIEWYVERAERCVEQIWRVACSAVEAGTDVVLEIGLIQRALRESFYARVDAAALDLTVYVVDAPRDVRRQRVRQRNREQGETFSMEVPDDFFELASDLWEPPTDDERAERQFCVVEPEPGRRSEDR